MIIDSDWISGLLRRGARRGGAPAGRAAAAGEERYRRLVDAMAEGVVECAADGTVLVWNPAAERIFGVRGRDLVGRRWLGSGWELMREDGSRLAAEELPLARTLRSGEPCTAVVVGVRRPGAGVRWLSVNSRSLGGAGDRSQGAVASFFDITERKQLEEQLDRLQREEQMTEAQLRLLESVAEQTREGIVIWSASSPRIVYVNPAVVLRTGYRRDELVGRSAELLLGTGANQGEVTRLRQCIAAGAPFRGEISFSTATGASGDLDLRVEPLRGPRADITHWVALGRDITAQKVAEAERERLRDGLSRSLLEWQQTFDSISMPVLLLDAGGAVSRLNAAARTLAGKSFSACLRQRLEELGSGEPWATAAHLAAAVQAAPLPAVVCEQHTWESRAWEIRVHPSPQGGVIVTLHDQTDLVRLQESLRRSATMSAMGMLVAGVAHEVRNPLFGLGALLDTFESQVEPRQPFPVEPFRRGLTRLQNLMQQLLDYGQPAPLQRSPHALGKTLQEAIDTCANLARERRVAVALAAPAGLPRVEIAESRMLQVFSNLLDNAIRCSPAGSSVTLTAAARGEWLECRVEDRGPGVAVEDLASIFEPFFTRRRGGTGLGLAIVQKIVVEHGGTVACLPRDGGGTCMCVRLPLPIAG
jgi:PAS domain S-box-containing protein